MYETEATFGKLSKWGSMCNFVASWRKSQDMLMCFTAPCKSKPQTVWWVCIGVKEAEEREGSVPAVGGQLAVILLQMP